MARKSRKQSYEAHDGFVQRALHAAEVHPEDMGDNRTVLQGGGLNPSEALLVELEAEDKAAKDAEDVLGISAPEAWGELGDGKADPGREAGLNEALGNMSDDSEQEVKPVGRQVEVGSIPVAGLREIIRDDTGDVSRRWWLARIGCRSPRVCVCVCAPVPLLRVRAIRVACAHCKGEIRAAQTASA